MMEILGIGAYQFQDAIPPKKSWILAKWQQSGNEQETKWKHVAALFPVRFHFVS